MRLNFTLNIFQQLYLQISYSSQRSILANDDPPPNSGLVPLFVNAAFLKYILRVNLCIVYSCFCTKRAISCSSKQTEDQAAQKA